MHRDIKPSNLGIVTWNPPVGVIFDLDAATCEETSDDHMQGTTCYLAPEIVALKQWAVSTIRQFRPAPYGRKVDVWALGLSAYETNAGLKMGNRCMTRQLYNMMRWDMEQEIQIGEEPVQVAFTKIILQMLCWDAGERSSAAKTVEAFQSLDGQADTRDLRTKRPHDGTSPLGRGLQERRMPGSPE